MPEGETIHIDVVSDVVCPWCYVGERHLAAALGLMEGIEAVIRWRPYQLDASIPPEGRDRQTYLLDKFGDPARIEAMHRRLRQMGGAAGIAFNFEAIKVSPNTLDAHRLIRWAASAGPGIQARLVRRLFQLYFEEGADIGRGEVLLDAARAAGMDAALAETLLPTGADRAEVEAEIATAHRMGITGVPCFLLEGRYALMGAQPPEALAGAIGKVAAAKAAGALDDETQE